MPWLSHGSAALSTPPQWGDILLCRRGNCLHIKDKK
jgi:hypothetical protein